MARALRVVVPEAWYHVTARGNRRSALFLNDQDRRRFLGLVSELPGQFQVEVHAYVLMDNHYHLVVRTPRGNLSHAIRWLNVTYSVRFNWAHRQSGHVFQGRFKALVIEDDARGLGEVVRYVHLNPVRIRGLGLGKADLRQAGVLGCDDPGGELVRRRLEVLRDWPWSSWRVYSGADPEPAWLEVRSVRGCCGGRSAAEQRKALRKYTEEPLRQGRMESPWERLVGGMVLGSEDFAQRILKQGARRNREQQTAARRLEDLGRPKLEEAIHAAEEMLGRPWKETLSRHGDWGRDGVMYVLVRHGRFRLTEVLGQLPGVRYSAAAQGIQRFGSAMQRDLERTRFVARFRRRLSQISND